MHKKYKIRKKGGWWYVHGHAGNGHYVQLSGRLTSLVTALAVVSLRESQYRDRFKPVYLLAGEDEYHPAEQTG